MTGHLDNVVLTWNLHSCVIRASVPYKGTSLRDMPRLSGLQDISMQGFHVAWHQNNVLVGAHVAGASIPLHRRYSYLLQGQQHPGSLRHHLVLHEAGITMGGAHADGSSQGQLFLLPLWPKNWPDSCLYSIINTLISCRE